MTLGTMFSSLPMNAEGIATLAAVVAATYLVARFIVKPATRRVVHRSKRLGDHLAKPLARFMLYLTMLAGLAAGLIAGGFQNVFAVLGAMMAAATFAFGFAMKDTLGAFIAGISIFFDEPFKIGDRIEWNGFGGIVRDIRIRTTKVETDDRELLTVPNDKITNAVVKNLSAFPERRHSLTFGIGHDVDIETAKYLIHSCASEVKGVLDDPAPTVRISEVDGSTVTIQLQYWRATEEERHMLDIKNDLYAQVKAAFEDKDIDIQ